MQDRGICYQMGEGENGLSLGGLGTGGIQLTTTGALACSTLQNNWMKELKTLLPGSFFAAYAATQDRRCAKILQASGPPDVVAIGDLTYCGRFPFAEICYHDDDLPVELSLEAFSPFIPYDAKNSAIPAAVFTFKVANQTDGLADVSLAFSWTNDIGAVEDKFRSNENRPGSSPGLTGLTLGTEREDSLRGHEYAVAVLDDDDLNVTYIANWKASGASTPFWKPFSECGELPYSENVTEKPVDIRLSLRTTPTGSVAAKMTLQPGEEREVSFIFTWFMPNHYGSSRKFIGHMYANWFSSAWDVATYVQENLSYLRTKSKEWQAPVYESSLPRFLKEALIANTYILPLSSWWAKDGRFVLGETPGWLMEMSALRPYDLYPTLMLFPELELMYAEIVSQHQLETGEIPTGLGNGTINAPNYRSFRQQNSPSFVINVYLDYLWIGGKPYLEQHYDSVKQAIKFTMTLDTDGDCLVNCDGIYDSAWDTWPVFGTSVYVAQFWLVALRAGEKIAQAMGDVEFAEECRQWGDTAVSNFEEQLWTGDYYALYRDSKLGDYSSSCFLGQFHGQMLGHLLGMGDILPPERVVRGLETINRLNVADSPYGATTGVKPDGRRDISSTTNAQSCCITPTELYPYTAICLYSGLNEIGLAASEKIWNFIERKKRDPWRSLLMFEPDTGENFYGAHYIDNLNVWSILLAAEGVGFDVSQGLFVLKPSIDPLTAPIFSAFFYGMMHYESRRENNEVVGLSLQLNNLRPEAVQVKKLVLRFDGVKVDSVKLTAGGITKALTAFALNKAGELVIEEEIVLKHGETTITVCG